MREFWAEFLATVVLMTFGLGVNAQVVLGTTERDVASAHLGQGATTGSELLQQRDFGDYYSINVGWGLAVMMGVLVAGGVTGAHMNPAVTVALAARGSLPWSKVGPFVIAQLLGALFASCLVYGVYREAIAEREGLAAWRNLRANGRTNADADGAVPVRERTAATAGIFGTFPRQFGGDRRLSNLGGLLDQMLGTALLLVVVCAVGDSENAGPPRGFSAPYVGAAVLAIGVCFGSNCGYAINPARDFGPRLFSFAVGWRDVFSRPDQVWWLIPIAGPLIGGVLGVVAYDQLIRRFVKNSSSTEPQGGS